ncbi:MAG TPA: DNA repair protein RecN [Bacteroidales bacterium]|nr:DNA repair protein RecN [Bacteroidales bacterium]
MLSNLIVENYALISKLDIEFKKGLTIITGETGAGKSILLGALALILGRRADTSVLYDKEKKCIVEGTFDITNYRLNNFFNDNALDYANQTIVRREILSSGKSRAFINDTPVNLELLSEFGSRLIDIHSQHQNLNLSNSLFQLKVLDSYARSGELLNRYLTAYFDYRQTEKNYRNLSENAAKMKADLDYFVFQFAQLDEAKLKAGEQEELELELEKLTHAEEIKNSLMQSFENIQGESMSAVQQVKDALSAISRIKKYLHNNENLADRINSAYIELKDIAGEIDSLNNQLSFDPKRLTEVNDRLNILFNLEKKHRVSGLDELIALRENFREKISEINSFEQGLPELEKKLQEHHSVLQEIAGELSSNRRKAVPEFERRIVSLLQEVGIPNAGFAVTLNANGDFTPTGADHIQFMFSANRNMKPQDIAKVASGGEISRLMLCIKSLMSDSTGLPTIIFDEIDTGVSGEIAERVGNIIFRMSEKMQIINITHLPQVASKGDYHFLVYKTDEGQSTVTRMKLLNESERHLEIAKMLSGEEVTPAALENARALLGK